MTVCEICGVRHGGEYGESTESVVRLLVTTFPKSGTNLILQFLGMPEHIQVGFDLLYRGLAVKPGNEQAAMSHLTVDDVSGQTASFKRAAGGHIPWTAEIEQSARKKETVIVQLIRDPRDVIVSHYFYAKNNVEAAFNFVYPDGRRLAERPDPIGDLIHAAPVVWQRFMAWLGRADLVVRFEDLIREPFPICERIFRMAGAGAVGASDPRAMMRRVDADRSPTFRKGLAGDWVNHFTSAHVRDYERLMGDLHRRLGYG